MNNELLKERNKEEYRSFFQEMKFAGDEEALEYRLNRDKLIKDLIALGAKLDYGDTKLDCRNLSPGCLRCGSGEWSCLFINGICNGTCFYCPTTQNDKSQPTTHTMEFPKVSDYLEYIELFKFTGVGLSGGEPLLTLDRTLEFLSEIKTNFGEMIHIWLYTNGIKLTEEIVRKLKDNGLDEIRFDLGAVNYNLDKVRLAAGHIKTVTVEIPAIPEDLELLKIKLKEMKEAGIHYLNLHQLRCTPHNCKELIKRGYTFLHGKKVLVKDSEMTALKLLKYSLENNIDLPINFCSFIYKNRYQGIALHRRQAELIKKTYEDITIHGMIRSISIEDSEDALTHLMDRFKKATHDSSFWYFDKTRKRLFFRPELAILVESNSSKWFIDYYMTTMGQNISFQHAFKEIKFKSGKKLYIEREKLTEEIALTDPDSIQAFKVLFLPGWDKDTLSIEEENRLKSKIPQILEIWEFERITPGL